MINKLDSKNLYYEVRFETRCPLLSPSSLGLIFCPLHSPEIAELLQGVQKSPKCLTAAQCCAMQCKTFLAKTHL